MRPASDALISKLNNDREFKCCDVYKIILRDNTTYYIADYDVDVLYSSHVYESNRFIMERTSTKLVGRPTVDSLSVNIYADRSHSDLINNVYVMQAIHNGSFDNAQITLGRAFFDDSNNVTGVLTLFTGKCEISSCNAMLCKLTVKSELTGLAAQIPLRVFAPQNSYNENSSGQVVTSSQDAYTCSIPLKPSANVLVRL